MRVLNKLVDRLAICVVLRAWISELLKAAIDKLDRALSCKVVIDKICEVSSALIWVVVSALKFCVLRFEICTELSALMSDVDKDITDAVESEFSWKLLRA